MVIQQGRGGVAAAGLLLVDSHPPALALLPCLLTTTLRRSCCIRCCCSAQADEPAPSGQDPGGGEHRQGAQNATAHAGGNPMAQHSQKPGMYVPRSARRVLGIQSSTWFVACTVELAVWSPAVLRS